MAGQGEAATDPLPHAALTDRQFGAVARAYVDSPVHATGSDLDAIAGIARAHRPAQALDLGCGGGHVSYALAPHAGAVTAFDLSPRMLAVVSAEAARRGIATIATRQGEAGRLPFETGRFDLVASRYSAHHWPDLAGGLAEAARVTRPGGRAVFADVVAPDSAPLDSLLQAVELLRDPSHGRDHGRAAWLGALTAAGFAVLGSTPGRLRLDFTSWVARIGTPPDRVAALRLLLGAAPAEAQLHFAIEADGSFSVDTLLIECVRAA